MIYIYVDLKLRLYKTKKNECCNVWHYLCLLSLMFIIWIKNFNRWQGQKLFKLFLINQYKNDLHGITVYILYVNADTVIINYTNIHIKDKNSIMWNK